MLKRDLSSVTRPSDHQSALLIVKSTCIHKCQALLDNFHRIPAAVILIVKAHCAGIEIRLQANLKINARAMFNFKKSSGSKWLKDQSFIGGSSLEVLLTTTASHA